MKDHSNSVMYCNVDLFPCYIAFTTSQKALERDCKKLFHVNLEFPKDGCACVYSLYREDDKSDTVIIMIYNRGEPKALYRETALIAHEAVHVWQYFKENINETGHCPEVEASVVGQVTQMILSWLGYK